MSGELTGAEPGLVAYWNMNEGSGTVLPDLGPHGIHANIEESIWTLGTPFEPSSIEVDQNLHYPRDLQLSSNYPNPFNASTHFELRVTDPGSVSVSIYTLSGSLVTELTGDQYVRGIFPLSWNGFNSQGKAMPAGVYIVTARNESSSVNQKICLLK